MHARCDRPHDVVHVEDVDVLVDDDHVLGVKLGAQRGHDRLLRLALRRFLHFYDGEERAARAVGHMDVHNVGLVAAQCVEDFAFARHAGDEDMVLRHA